MDEATLKRAAEPFFTTKGAGQGRPRAVDGLWSGRAIRRKWRASSARSGRYDSGGVVSVRGAGGCASDGPAPRVVSQQRRARAISLVDDNPLVAESLDVHADHLGHCVTVASSGAEALALLFDAGHDIDLVITDNAMPGMTAHRSGRAPSANHPRLPVDPGDRLRRAVGPTKARTSACRGSTALSRARLLIDALAGATMKPRSTATRRTAASA